VFDLQDKVIGVGDRDTLNGCVQSVQHQNTKASKQPWDSVQSSAWCYRTFLDTLDGQDCAPGITHHRHLSALTVWVSGSPGELGGGGEPLLSYYSNQVLSCQGWDAEEQALWEDGSEAPGTASFCSECELVPFRAPWPGLLPLILKCQKLIKTRD